MDSRVNRETLYPKCLALRIHSSLLPSGESRNESSENGFLLSRDLVLKSKERNRNNGTTKSQESYNANDGRVYKREDDEGTSHVFLLSENVIPSLELHQYKIDHKNEINHFGYVSSTVPERIVVQPSVDEIKEYGRRARVRLEQQRQNRKGIKVIDGSPLIPVQDQKRANHKTSSSRDANIGKRRQRQERHSRTKQSLAREMELSVWTPDVSHLSLKPKDAQSTYVKLHGLPIGSSLETVRKFFTGIAPQRILVLLSNRTHIPALDSTLYDELAEHKLQDLVYADRDIRVLIKFDSTVAARLAEDRSGETISSKHVNNHSSKLSDSDGETPVSHRNNPKNMQENRETNVQDKFSIGVTMISKVMASSLSKLAFDARPGIPFHDCLTDIESKMEPNTREILWANARKACKVPVESEIEKANILLDDAERENESMNERDFLTFAEYKEHSIHFNRLLRIQDDIVYSIQGKYLTIDTFSPKYPIVQLSARACMVLDEEMDRIDNLLFQYRASRYTDNK